MKVRILHLGFADVMIRFPHTETRSAELIVGSLDTKSRCTTGPRDPKCVLEYFSGFRFIVPNVRGVRTQFTLLTISIVA